MGQSGCKGERTLELSVRLYILVISQSTAMKSHKHECLNMSQASITPIYTSRWMANRFLRWRLKIYNTISCSASSRDQVYHFYGILENFNILFLLLMYVLLMYVFACVQTCMWRHRCTLKWRPEGNIWCPCLSLCTSFHWNSVSEIGASSVAKQKTSQKNPIVLLSSHSHSH